MTLETQKVPSIGMRHLQALLLFLATVLRYQVQAQVNVAIIAMTHIDNANPDFPHYAWTEKHRSYILSSFYWGLLPMILPGALICRQLGSTFCMTISMLGIGLMNAMTPLCIAWGGWQYFCITRVLIGICQGLLFPSVLQHMSNWFTPPEKNLLGSIVFMGADVGIILGAGSSGFIVKSSLGWPGIFYISAILCTTLGFLWIFLGANTPKAARCISKKERLHLELVIAQDKKSIPIPWRAIFTSKPFYACILVLCGFQWGDSTIQMQLPAYFQGVLHMDIRNNGFYSASSYFASLVGNLLCTLLAELLIRHKVCSMTVLRRSFNSVAFWGSAVAMICFAYLRAEQETLAIVIVTLKALLSGALTIGSGLNIFDLAPNHAALLLAFISMAASLCALLEPLWVGIIVTDTSDVLQWRIVFGFMSFIYFITNLIYILAGSTKEQPWNAADYLQPKTNS